MGENQQSEEKERRVKMSTVKDEKIYSTMDYGIFKRLKGNRAVTNNRIGIIKDCIA